MHTYAFKLRLPLIAALVGSIMVPIRDASAQLTPTLSTTQCVGGAIGCSQVDFFLQFIALPVGGLTIDRFSLTLTTGMFRFASPGVSEAEDALGLNFYSPFVSADGGTLVGTFDFVSFVDSNLGNTLRIRAEMSTSPVGATDPALLSYAYALESEGRVISDSNSPVTATPEPGTFLLAATGMAGLARFVKKRGGRGDPGRVN